MKVKEKASLTFIQYFLKELKIVLVTFFAALNYPVPPPTNEKQGRNLEKLTAHLKPTPKRARMNVNPGPDIKIKL